MQCASFDETPSKRCPFKAGENTVFCKLKHAPLFRDLYNEYKSVESKIKEIQQNMPAEYYLKKLTICNNAIDLRIKFREKAIATSAKDVGHSIRIDILRKYAGQCIRELKKIFSSPSSESSVSFSHPTSFSPLLDLQSDEIFFEEDISFEEEFPFLTSISDKSIKEDKFVSSIDPNLKKSIDDIQIEESNKKSQIRNLIRKEYKKYIKIIKDDNWEKDISSAIESNEIILQKTISEMLEIFFSYPFSKDFTLELLINLGSLYYSLDKILMGNNIIDYMYPLHYEKLTLLQKHNLVMSGLQCCGVYYLISKGVKIDLLVFPNSNINNKKDMKKMLFLARECQGNKSDKFIFLTNTNYTLRYYGTWIISDTFKLFLEIQHIGLIFRDSPYNLIFEPKYLKTNFGDIFNQNWNSALINEINKYDYLEHNTIIQEYIFQYEIERLKLLLKFPSEIRLPKLTEDIKNLRFAEKSFPVTIQTCDINSRFTTKEWMDLSRYPNIRIIHDNPSKCKCVECRVIKK